MLSLKRKTTPTKSAKASGTAGPAQITKKRRVLNQVMPLFAATLMITTTLVLSSCTSVKAYQKMYLADPCMDLAPNKLDYFETNFHTYREGASGANGGKVGGGCGCN